MKATAPDGREWHVSQSVSWPTQRFSTDLDDIPFIDVGPSDGPLGVALAIAVVTILFVVLLPFIVLGMEAVIVVLLTVLALRTWIVRAECGDAKQEWQVRGFFRAHKAVREIAGELQRGVPAAPLDDPRTVA